MRMLMGSSALLVFVVGGSVTVGGLAGRGGSGLQVKASKQCLNDIEMTPVGTSASAMTSDLRSAGYHGITSTVGVGDPITPILAPFHNREGGG